MIVSMSIIVIGHAAAGLQAPHRPAPDNCGLRPARRDRHNRPRATCARAASRRKSRIVDCIATRSRSMPSFTAKPMSRRLLAIERASLDGIGQRRDVRIGAVADHQRDAPRARCALDRWRMAAPGCAALAAGGRRCCRRRRCCGDCRSLARRRRIRQQRQPDLCGGLIGFAAGIRRLAFERGGVILLRAGRNRPSPHRRGRAGCRPKSARCPAAS